MITLILRHKKGNVILDWKESSVTFIDEIETNICLVIINIFNVDISSDY